LDSAGYVGAYTSITIGTDGLPIISYYDDTNGDVKVAHCDDIACASATVATLDSVGSGGFGIGWFTSITIGADGLPIISYFDNNNRDLKVAHCAGIACASASVATLDSVGDVGAYTSITIGADGLPIISYYDDTNGDVKVARCSNAFCAPYFRRR
jgi:predicted regulator of Ras-like GTPase activity (Roadblock/LC7/MglB family)